MNWTEITARVSVKDSETAAAIANMTVPYGIYIEDYSDIEQAAQEIAHIDLIDEELIAKERDVAIIHIYISECDNPAEAIAFLKERLSAAGIAAEIGSVEIVGNGATAKNSACLYIAAEAVRKRYVRVKVSNTSASAAVLLSVVGAAESARYPIR